MRALCDIYHRLDVRNSTGKQRDAALPYAFAVVFGDQRRPSISRVTFYDMMLSSHRIFAHVLTHLLVADRQRHEAGPTVYVMLTTDGIAAPCPHTLCIQALAFYL
eukprot:21567-Heterococcus_DN1.PRE.3